MAENGTEVSYSSSSEIYSDFESESSSVSESSLSDDELKSDRKVQGNVTYCVCI